MVVQVAPHWTRSANSGGGGGGATAVGQDANWFRMVAIKQVGAGAGTTSVQIEPWSSFTAYAGGGGGGVSKL